MVRATLASKCARIRIPNWFFLNGSRASVQKMRGVTRPQDHHWVKEPSRARLQLLDERFGNANSTPRVLHSRIAAIHGAHRFFISKLYNSAKNAVENSPC